MLYSIKASWNSVSSKNCFHYTGCRKDHSHPTEFDPEINLSLFTISSLSLTGDRNLEKFIAKDKNIQTKDVNGAETQCLQVKDENNIREKFLMPITHWLQIVQE